MNTFEILAVACFGAAIVNLLSFVVVPCLWRRARSWLARRRLCKMRPSASNATLASVGYLYKKHYNADYFANITKERAPSSPFMSSATPMPPAGDEEGPR
jgi:hypothetical protein